MDGMAVDTEVGMAVDMSQCEHFASGPLSPDERWEPWDKYMDERISQEAAYIIDETDWSALVRGSDPASAPARAPPPEIVMQFDPPAPQSGFYYASSFASALSQLSPGVAPLQPLSLPPQPPLSGVFACRENTDMTDRAGGFGKRQCAADVEPSKRHRAEA